MANQPPSLNFQDWARTRLPASRAIPIPMPGYHYSSFVQTVDQVNKTPGTQGKDDFWMKMCDGFAEDTWKVTPNFTVTAGVRYDIQLTPNPGLVEPLVRSDLVGVHQLDQERDGPCSAARGLLVVAV